jgi:hypothetical protein
VSRQQHIQAADASQRFNGLSAVSFISVKNPVKRIDISLVQPKRISNK